MLRILVSNDEHGPVIRLEGKLRRAWLPEVQAALAAARAGGPCRLDLGGLAFADPDGVEFLRQAQAGGVRLLGASPFVAELLAHAIRPLR